METTLEVLTTAKAAGERHRQWPEEVGQGADRLGEFAARRDGERGGGTLWVEAEPPVVMAHDGAAG
ncbi:hypothetical protein Q1M63_02520 (plasmid) [Sinorhizobium meliloti]|nr:hypothetical protein Q1M63_02520 [Sinorhizobium meliloti]